MTNSLDNTVEDAPQYMICNSSPSPSSSCVLSSTPMVNHNSSAGPHDVCAVFSASSQQSHVNPTKLKQASVRDGSFFWQCLVVHHVVLNLNGLNKPGVRVMDDSPEGYMVVDTACMRMVAGCTWLQLHLARLLNMGYNMIQKSEHEMFVFGDSDPVKSNIRFVFPAAILGIPLLIRSSSVVNNVPLLASKQFLDLAGAVIDLFGMTISFVCLGIFRIPLQIHEHGHLCVPITAWPKGGFPQDADFWSEVDTDFSAPPDIAAKMQSLVERRQQIRVPDCPKYFNLALNDERTPKVVSGDLEAMFEIDDCESLPDSECSFQSCNDIHDTFSSQELLPSQSSSPSHTLLAAPFVDADSADSSTQRVGSHYGSAHSNVPPHEQNDARNGSHDSQANHPLHVHAVDAKHCGDVPGDQQCLSVADRSEPQPSTPCTASSLRSPRSSDRKVNHEKLRGQLGQGSEMFSLPNPPPVDPSPNGRRNLGRLARENPFQSFTGILLALSASVFSRGAPEAVAQLGQQLSSIQLSDPKPPAGFPRQKGDVPAKQESGESHGVHQDSWLGGRHGHAGGVLRHRMGRGRGAGRKPGLAKQLASEHSKVTEALELEHRIYSNQSRNMRTMHSRIPTCSDLIEGCAGEALCTRLAPEYGLQACQPADLDYGWDLATPYGRGLWKRAITERKPLLVVWGHPCTLWCIYNRNINYRDRLELLHALQDSERPLVKLAAWTFLEQIKGGRLFLLENPPTSDLWNQSDFDPVFSHPDVVGDINHMCMHGSTGLKEGKPIHKGMKLASNSEELLEAVVLKCDRSHEHELVEGINTKWSQRYTPEFCHKILTYLQILAARRNPLRFTPVRNCSHLLKSGKRWNVLQSDWVPSVTDTVWQAPGVCSAHHVLYLDANRDTHEWGLLLDLANHSVQSSSLQTWEPPADHQVRVRVQELVPWELDRVQVVKLPRSRRLPTDIPIVHRGAALLFNDGEVRIETEPISVINMPRQRFDRPVRLAIFFYGRAPEDPNVEVAPSLDQDPEVPLHDSHSLGALIRFEGISKDQVPFPVRSSVARMHVNLGHPPKGEFMRFLQSSGAAPAVLLAASALKCESCERHPHLPRHRPAKITRFLGQFGERIIGDVFYALDTRGQAWQLVGFICDSTDLHLVKRIPDRVPRHVLESFEVMWILPFGLPIEVVVDEDGCFMGDFVERLTSLGVLVRHIPPDQHHQLGKIERHNHAWRWIWNRTCDQRAVCTVDQVDDCVLAVSHGKNSTVKRHGRSCYAQAFGRMPRLPGELLADPDALAVDLDDGSRTLQVELYRCDAIKNAATSMTK